MSATPRVRRVRFYHNENGRRIAREEFLELSEDGQAALGELFMRFENALERPAEVQPVSDGLIEFRTRVANNQYRAYAFKEGPRYVIVVLCVQKFFVLEIEYSVQVEAVDDDGDSTEADHKGKGDDDESEEVVAFVTFKLAGLYSLDPPKGGQGPTTSELDSYAKTMGAMALYPYAREFVQSSFSRMGLPPLTLSTFHLPYPDTTVAPSFPGAGPAAAD
jgi:hypothetical protein